MRTIFTRLILLLLLSLAAARAQDDPRPEAPVPVAPESIKALETMRAFKVSISEAEAELKAKRSAQRAAATDAARVAIDAEIQALDGRLATLRFDLEEIATGIDLRTYSAQIEESVDMGSEMQEFLQPIIRQLKEMTSRPREIEALKNNVAFHTRRKQLAEKALGQVEALLAAGGDSDIVKDLEGVQKAWKQRLEQAENSLTIAEFQLETKRAEGGTIFSAVREATASFFRTRGRNLIMAVAAFLAVLSLLRLIHRYLHRLSPMRKRGKRSVAVRLVDIGYYVFTFVASTGVFLSVLYLTDDWVLLGLAILLLVGVAWTGKHSLPLFYEQAKLMLNLGSVREGERVLYNGVPWKVEAINIFTDLTNPLLQGGCLRLPLRELVPLLSRPFASKEPWFPCEEGDWLILSDGTFGKILAQTPEWVQLVKLGGSRKTYTTMGFIALNPENLSKNFRVRTVFGVDYRHQGICTTEVPRILEDRVRAGLEDFVGAENLYSLAVEFREAGTSSLDYAILADFSGEVAASHNKISRAIPRFCVDACNVHGWVIPFTQVTLHQAAPAPAAKG